MAETKPVAWVLSSTHYFHVNDRGEYVTTKVAQHTDEAALREFCRAKVEQAFQGAL